MDKSTRRALAGLVAGFGLICFYAASGCANDDRCASGQSGKQAMAGLLSLYGAYRLYSPTQETN